MSGKNCGMTISFQEINAQLGTVFIVHTQSGVLELKLMEASERPRRGLPESFRTPFSLVFAGPAKPTLAQDSYFLDHPLLGRNQWLLVPISRYALPAESDVPLYEAVFG
jgi:hypothetical protein